MKRTVIEATELLRVRSLKERADALMADLTPKERAIVEQRKKLGREPLKASLADLIQAKKR